jgi:hypothetical protein
MGDSDSPLIGEDVLGDGYKGLNNAKIKLSLVINTIREKYLLNLSTQIFCIKRNSVF